MILIKKFDKYNIKLGNISHKYANRALMNIIQDSFENISDVRIPLTIIHSDFQGLYLQVIYYDLMFIVGFHPGRIDTIKLLGHCNTSHGE